MNQVPLGEVAEFINGRAFKPSDWVSQGLPIIRIQNLTNEQAAFNYYDKEVESKYYVKDGDLLVSWSASLDAFIWNRGEAVLNQHIFKAVPDNSKISKAFLFYALKHVMDDLRSKTHGATMKHITRKPFENTKIYLPPLPEQERIVRLLDEAEALRTQRAQSNERMEDFVPALFDEMFGDPVKTKFPVKTLNEVADVVSGIAKGRKFNGQKPVTINYLRVANVQAGYLDLSEIKTIEALSSEVERLQVRVGDVLLTEGGDFDKLGRGAMLEVDLPNCIHQNHVFRARVNQDYLLPLFFHDFLQTQQAKKYFLSCAKKTTNLASINLTQLRALPVPLPPITLQQEFAERVKEAREVQSAQGRSTERVEALYQSMLDRAFKGEL